MIKIQGARQNNLKGINLELPDEKLIVITGVSGSGKSSLAFDTIYAEGQRRYVETFSSYARQFLEQLEKPLVDVIEGLSPSISIDQKPSVSNPRSTVGTVTECYDYMRLLFARTGIPHCPSCKIPVEARTFNSIFNFIVNLPEGKRIQILSPIIRGRKGEYRELLEDLASEGFSRVRIDGEIKNLSDEIRLARHKLHDIDLLVDRLTVKPLMDERLTGSLNLALHKGDGRVIIDIKGEGENLFNMHMSCPVCGFSPDEITPKMFSFTGSYGACPVCKGSGFKRKVEPSLLIKNPDLTLKDGAIPILKSGRPVFLSLLKKVETLLQLKGVDLNSSLSQIDKNTMDLIFYGSSDQNLELIYRPGKGKEPVRFKSRFDGIIKYLEEIYHNEDYRNTHSDIEDYVVEIPCDACKGMRLSRESLSVKVGERSIGEMVEMSLGELYTFLSDLKFSSEKEETGRVILKEILTRLDFLIDLGVAYLTLNRSVSTLSGGEMGRIRLATQIGSGLVGVLYILDEPTVGLHQRDNCRLIKTLENLRDLGNTVIVVEHDEQTMRTADYIVDLGPGAGRDGGEVVVAGQIKDITENPLSLTGRYLAGKDVIAFHREKEVFDGKFLTVKGAGEHNLKNIDVSFPLGLFTCVTGVSGSGKSTLVNDILYKALAKSIHGAGLKPGLYDEIEGMEYIDKVIMIDQSPIGRTPRSNPATYTGVLTPIRELFALTPGARLRGYKKGRFSFNVSGGRCEKCLGSGRIQIEMQFLPDLYITCDECKGRRYNKETLEIEFKEKNIFQVLEMTVREALDFFSDFSKITGILAVLEKVGLGYIQLGQAATLLSGGEAQRIKLAAELARKATGKTLYILDEPTTGLHFYDVAQLLKVLRELCSNGNTIIVIEHNMDVIKSSDYIIDLGPEGGDEGGYVVATGPPGEITENSLSHTGRFLKKNLSSGQKV